MNDESETLAQFKRVLWQDWDPIGVHMHAGAVGEYDDYAVEAYALALRGVNAAAIAHYLLRVECNTMGYGERPGARARCEDIARRLVSLLDQ